MRTRCVILLLLGLALVPARAQFDPSGSPAGINAALTQLFGANTNFTARAEVRVLGKDRAEKIFTPMDFALLGEQVRAEIDLTQMKHRQLPANAAASLRQIGMDRTISIFRSGQPTALIIFPGLQAYVNVPLPKEETATFRKTPGPQVTPLGRETLDGQVCMKNKVVITDDQGQPHEATVWSVPALRDFPIQILTREKEDTVILRFRQIKLGKPDARQFETPSGYKQYSDITSLVQGVMVKALGELVSPPAD